MPTRILTLHSFCLSHFSLQEIQLEVFSERRDGGGGLVKKNLTGSHRCHGIMQKVCCGTCCFLFKTMTVEVLSSLGINAKCVRTNPAVTCKRKQTYKPKKKKNWIWSHFMFAHLHVWCFSHKIGGWRIPLSRKWWGPETEKVLYVYHI